MRGGAGELKPGKVKLDQFLNSSNIIGCFLILIAVIFSQLAPSSKN